MPVDVKICGLKDAASVRTALDAGADFIGFVFYPPSPRYLTPDAAARLAEPARGRAKIVALVVDPDDHLVNEIAEKVRPDYIQAHGSESPERIAGIARLAATPVIKAIKVRRARGRGRRARLSRRGGDDPVRCQGTGDA